MKESSEFTSLFATQFQKAMEDCDVLGKNREIIIEKLESAFYSGDLNINQLSAGLGREWLVIIKNL